MTEEKPIVGASYKWIFIFRTSEGKRTNKYSVRNKKTGHILGKLIWHTGWRQYCYFPRADCVYSAGCLKDIAGFLEVINHEHKMKRKGGRSES
jgi:hypothetical protein